MLQATGISCHRLLRRTLQVSKHCAALQALFYYFIPYLMLTDLQTK